MIWKMLDRRGNGPAACLIDWQGAVLGEPVPARDVGEAMLVRGYPTLVKTAQARLWVAAAVRQLAARRPPRPITAAVAVECRAWGRCSAAALAPELIAEALERAGIVADGRQIREAHVYTASDRARPRVELSVRVLT
jgi:hypothetical protein